MLLKDLYFVGHIGRNIILLFYLRDKE